jgi:phosphoserine phosphatase
MAELTALIDEVAVQLAPRARPEVRELLRAARAEGFAVHVVTGSLGIAVEATLRWAEIPFDRVAGGVLRVDGDFARATMARTCPLFEGKVDALREGGQWPAAIGLGDGGWDHTFLRQVHVPVLVHPKPALETAMQDVLHAVVLRATA